MSESLLRRIAIMRCNFCHGSGLCVSPKFVVPCVECGGFGLLQPCEGLRAQPYAERQTLVSEFDMARMIDWAARSNQRVSTHFIRYLEVEDELIPWNSIVEVHARNMAVSRSHAID
jgi:hypothetical protein